MPQGGALCPLFYYINVKDKGEFSLKFRQLHLDFHTSEDIPGIGEEFDRKGFIAALKEGHIDSVTLFSKCHHGWSYHPTTKCEIHPNLKFDLLSAQIDAARAAGAAVQIYISAGLDEKMARRHPEWLIRAKNEQTTWARSFAEPGYHRMCFNSPYLPYLIGQIEEVMEKFTFDGLFLDIAGVVPCWCQNCVRTMRGRGLDPYDDKNASALAQEVYINYTRAVRSAVDKYKKDFPVFHNGGHVIRGRRDIAGTNSHCELESLPTGDYGYEHFPLSAAYVRTLGVDYLGMTGKFHTAWGENGGFKHPNALRYEVALNCVYGAASSVGDQLHPSGKADDATYKLIGAAYSELEEKEQYIKETRPIADIALLSAEAIDSYYQKTAFSGDMDIMANAQDEGALRILHEGKYLFNVIDTYADFNLYKLIVLPDTIELDAALYKKLSDYVSGGGKVLATGKSALFEGKLPEFFGVEFLGENPYRPDYIHPLFPLKSLGESDFVMYEQGYAVKKTHGECTAHRVNPYFNRTALHFSSHKHAPANPKSAEDGIIKTDKTVFIPWEIFKDYRKNGSIVSKEIVHYALDALLGSEKTLETDLPAGGIVSLSEKRDGRKILQLLYAQPVLRGVNTEIIEDIVPLYNVKVRLKADKRPEYVYSHTQKGNTDFTYENGALQFTVPKLLNHEILVIGQV